jgi:hypothetical protein
MRGRYMLPPPSLSFNYALLSVFRARLVDIFLKEYAQ